MTEDVGMSTHGQRCEDVLGTGVGMAIGMGMGMGVRMGMEVSMITKVECLWVSTGWVLIMFFCTYHSVERLHSTICNHIACNVIPSACAVCEVCVCVCVCVQYVKCVYSVCVVYAYMCAVEKVREGVPYSGVSV